MSIFGAMDISATGMTAQQLRTDVIAQNIANINTNTIVDFILFMVSSYL